MPPRLGPGSCLRGRGLYDDEGLRRSAAVLREAPGAPCEGRGHHTPRGARRGGRGCLFRARFAARDGGWGAQGGPDPGQRSSWAIDEERRRTERRRKRFGAPEAAPCATRDLRRRRPRAASRPRPSTTCRTSSRSGGRRRPGARRPSLPATLSCWRPRHRTSSGR
jgi:hypothetical protein